MTLTRQGANTVQHIPKCPGNAGCQNKMRELHWQPFIDVLHVSDRAHVWLKKLPRDSAKCNGESDANQSVLDTELLQIIDRVYGTLVKD